VRLYQYKYPNEAGVPPVKRGMLMCYNAGDIKDKEGANSIFDKDEIMEYLDAKAYPVPLDYALPVFEWALLFHDGKLKTILSSDVLLSENLQMKDENHYEVINDHVLGYRHSGTYLRKGDEIKIERPALEDVKEVAEWLSVNRNNKDASLSLYHLSNVYLQTHHDEMEDIFRSF
jgi:hypothetical protein